MRMKDASRFALSMIALTCGVGVGACASTSPDPAFHTTAAMVEARTGRRVTWNRGGASDADANKMTHALLAADLTVDTAVQIALLNNASLQATYEDLSIAQADLVQAGLLANPVFGAGVALPLSGSVRSGVNLSVSEDFLSVFLIAARKKVADAELRATESRVGDAVLRMACAVQTAFYRLAAAQQIVAMRRTLQETGAAAIDMANRQHEAGNISDLDLATETAASEELATDLIRSESEVAAAHEELARLLGIGGAESPFQVSAKLPELPERARGDLDLEAIESRALAHRLDLAAAHEEVEARSHALSLGRGARWLGGSSIGASYDHAPERYSVIGPTAGVELPIFDQKQAVIARLEAELRIAEAREKALAAEVRSQVREAVERVLAARAVVDRYATVMVPLRERVLDLSQQEYNAMLLGVYQLLQAKQGALTSYRELIEASRDYWTARAELDRAAGGTIAVRANTQTRSQMSHAEPQTKGAP
jgi:cobalt-zinc-cadmium efflux system outer membrane protein